MIRISNIESPTLAPSFQASLSQAPRVQVKTGIRDLSDAELLNRLRSKDANASFSELYRRYAGLVMGVCMKYLKDRDQSEDASSDIFARLWEKLKEHQPENLKSWLYTVTRNHCLQYLSRDKYRNLSAPLMQESEETLAEEENQEAQRREMIATAMEKAMAEIPESQRTCLQMFFFDKRSYMEIAHQTGMELKKVKSHLQNGKRNLKLLLESKSSNFRAAINY